ncbi:hypothetical protein CBM2634_U260002 [Cupriavidus taiwanensis]|uniref:Transposase IS204/IS1001/IS1096/IS1165 zinc-finger domain-containing protein n=1 Tax=Cupriavidus taiwanensis TaxID=164546 RepID=A0A375JDT7_9BURK|nr:transposase family protein [Cupriavidus taiwanensis]SPS02731.1 hypothetical protein CBM2634_U260002 [Cupriavidus taiwanensis]
MLLTRLLNACHHFPGFVYEGARLCEATQSIEIDVRPRKGSKPACSCCNQPARDYDSLTERRFEFIPVWGFAVFLLYTMRRVDCRDCGVKVEALPWANGKHTLTRAYMISLCRLLPRQLACPLRQEAARKPAWLLGVASPVNSSKNKGKLAGAPVNAN